MTISRRQFFATSTAASALFSQVCPAAPNAQVLETRVISHLRHRYHGWPTLAKRRTGELLLVCSGGRESHVCPFGRVELMRSHDEGKTWTWPEVIMDGPIDDRDAGILETKAGTLLVTSFTSLAYVPSLEKAIQSDDWKQERLKKWRSAHERVDADTRKAALGVWMKRSTDGGVTWSGRYESGVSSPHGPIQLSDGRLLYAGKELWKDPTRVGVCESTDDGKSWTWLAEIPMRQGDVASNYHELHAVESASGRIVIHLRNHNERNNREILQTESHDGGRTWSDPHAIGVWGLPSHLIRLDNDRLMMTYGHRRNPLGNQARVSEDEGRSWSDPMTISHDGSSGDLGYPSTVQLEGGTMLTVWYEKMPGNQYAQLRQARWQLHESS